MPPLSPQYARQGQEKAVFPMAVSRTRWGGLAELSPHATGFFKVAQRDGVWWLIDPDGGRFISKGVNTVRFDQDAIRGTDIIPYADACKRKYGSDGSWRGATARRLVSWGFNTLGAWSDDTVAVAAAGPAPLALTPILDLGATFGSRRPGEPPEAFPDIFDSDFGTHCKGRAAELCFPRQADPTVIGWFTDNELRWGPDWRGNDELLTIFLNWPPARPGRHAAIALIKERYRQIDAFNAVWRTNCRSWDELAATRSVAAPYARRPIYDRNTATEAKENAADPKRAAFVADCEAFAEKIAILYFTATNAAIRAVDPNHLVLGCRFAFAPEPAIIEAAARNVDVLSFNCYDFTAAAPIKSAGPTGKLLMITEFSFRGDDAGLPNTEGAAPRVPTQAERARYFQRYVEEGLRSPALVGYHWFEHADQPAEGRFDGENSNYGTVTIRDEVYGDLTRAMTATNAAAEQILRRSYSIGGVTMSDRAKIVFIGAGSMSFGLSMFRDVFSNGALSHSTLTLVDQNEENLLRMAGLARVLNEASGAGLTIEHTTDRRAALDGAGFVVNATAIDRLAQWKLDFEIPRKYGIRHTLGENGGPGAVFFSLRTLPLVFDIIRDMEELCPDALFINFSNPESRIILALGKYSKIHAIGLCHGIFMSQEDVAHMIGLPTQQIEVWGAGLNHFQWLLHIRERATGTDLYPLLRQKERACNTSSMPLTRRLFRAFGYWPTCSDEHLGEYLAYGWEGGEHGYDFARDECERAEFQSQLDAVISNPVDLPPDWLTASGERGAAVVAGILHNQNRFIELGIVYNEGVIPNLPAGGRRRGSLAGGRRGRASDIARSVARRDRQAFVRASQCSAIVGRGGRSRLKRNRTASIADRSRGQFRRRGRQTARRTLGRESGLHKAMHLRLLLSSRNDECILSKVKAEWCVSGPFLT